MAKRTFKLPELHELTEEQLRVNRFPKHGQFLVVGGPGTGKSVVALLRAMKFADEDYLFLTYNHVLSHSSRQLLTEGDLKADTATSWFYKTYCDRYGHYVPEIKDRIPDYSRIADKYRQENIPEHSTQLIVDEAQDMGTGYYECLMELGYTNFFLLADQNQQITEDHSNRVELTDLLGLDTSEVIELKTNHRNSTPIARLASHFYTDISSPQPELPDRPSIDTPILYEYSRVDSCVELILREADKDDTKLIGVIVPSDTKREDYVNKLNKMEINRDNPKPLVSTYSNSHKAGVNIDFSVGGIVVLNDKSVKGIEFDTVFVITDGLKIINNDPDLIKKRLYVMCSRAREKLVILKSATLQSNVIELFPRDENVLIRSTL
ncbi:DUF2075 domain-containing protein [Endozoicomonas sp. ONNA2]|uniref:DUF2075 domain-containing protein n=1 Tax=Endozoicomonas sp. ONNA2 TaxID=2828741 RepID=UPI002148E605